MLEIQKFNKMIVANWKLNGSLSFSKEYFANINYEKLLDNHNCAVICAPFPYISLINDDIFYKGAQDCSLYLKGAYTGETSIEMLKDIDGVKKSQSDINNFIGRFLDKDNLMKDEAGYHKSLYTAMNADAVANHFYEQGKADALKESVAKSKNISMDPRQQHSGEINTGGVKVRVLGDNSSDFKFKIKNK